jgi:hypothetical protein
MMKRVARLSLVVLAVLLARPLLATDDVLIIAGAGFAGKWDTAIDLANVSEEPIEVRLSIPGLPLAIPCPPNCTGQTYTLPGAGTLLVLASDFLGAMYPGPQLVRVEALDGAPLPSVHARSVSTEDSCQFAELPVLRESAIKGLAAPVLAFPGAARGDGVYSNLILEALQEFPVTVEVELRSASGDLLGSGTFVVPGTVTATALTVVDVVGVLGVANVGNGQIRVRNVTGTGAIWGVLTTVAQNGSLRVAVGGNP